LPRSYGGRRSRVIHRGRIPKKERTIWRRTCAWLELCVVPVQPAAIELLRDLSRVLNRWGRWYVFGAQAVIAYGVPRLSADVDVTLFIESDEPERLVAAMQDGGFDLLVNDPDFVKRTRVMPFAHRATAMPVDIVFAGSGLEREFLDRAEPVDIGGIVVPLIHAEDLMIAKILAGRPKDIEDARALWKTRGTELDGERIRRVLRLLEEALSQSDLLPAFDSIAS